MALLVTCVSCVCLIDYCYLFVCLLGFSCFVCVLFGFVVLLWRLWLVFVIYAFDLVVCAFICF